MTDDETRQVGTPEPEPEGRPPAGTPEAPPNGMSSAPEPASSAAATSPVQGSGARPGPSRARWAIGIGVAGLAVAGIIAAVIVFGSRPTPPALTYIPADAIMVAELRPDLPGDQMQKLGNLLANFPGFADQSTLPDKLDEAFAQLFNQSSGGSVDYRGDIKPWTSGAAFVALLPPSTASQSDPMSFLRGVASLTTTGTVSCDALYEGQTVTHETYRNLDLALGAGGATACAIDGTQALVGDPESVRKAIDAHADSNGIDSLADYQKARAALQGDQLGTIYVSGTGYLDMLGDVAGMAPGGAEMLDCLPTTFPAWAVQGLRVEDDAVVYEAVTGPAPAPTAGATPGVSLLPIPAAHASAILPYAPANTVAYFELQGTGVAFQNAIAQLRACPMYGPMLEGLGDMDPNDLAGWIEDIGLIVAHGDAGPTGGLIVIAKDATAAAERAGALKGLLSLAAMGGAVGLTTSDSTVAGVTVTTVTISDLGTISGGQIPPEMLPADGTLEFSIATKDRTILLTSGDAASFMTTALTMPAGQGLADQASYKAATSRALPAGQITMFVDIRGIVTAVEPLIPAESRAQWDSDIKPYVAPFQALSMTSSVDAAMSGRARLTLTINTP